MTAVATFLNVAEAELAKLSLQEHGIFCEVIGENAHLYGGAPFAMPIRLLVEEARLEEARRILRGVNDVSDDDLSPPPAASADYPKIAQRKNNPWEILALAGLLLLPAIGLMLQGERTVFVVRRRLRSFVILSPQFMHVLGVLIFAGVIGLVVFYCYMRRLIAADELNSRK